MGTCESRSPIRTIIQNYGQKNVQAYFLSSYQLKYLVVKQKNVSNNIEKDIRDIETQKVKQIWKRYDQAESSYKQFIHQMNQQHIEEVKSIELSQNITLEQKIEFNKHKQKFIELEIITRKNIEKEKSKVLTNVKQKLAKVQQKLKQKQPSISIYLNLTEKQKYLVQQQYKKQNIDKFQKLTKELDHEIDDLINIDNYSKQFIEVLPKQQLDSITNYAQLDLKKEQQKIKSYKRNWCCY